MHLRANGQVQAPRPRNLFLARHRDQELATIIPSTRNVGTFIARLNSWSFAATIALDLHVRLDALATSQSDPAVVPFLQQKPGLPRVESYMLK